MRKSLVAIVALALLALGGVASAQWPSYGYGYGYGSGYGYGYGPSVYSYGYTPYQAPGVSVYTPFGGVSVNPYVPRTYVHPYGFRGYGVDPFYPRYYNGLRAFPHSRW
jgi:hypothetical protein